MKKLFSICIAAIIIIASSGYNMFLSEKSGKDKSQKNKDRKLELISDIQKDDSTKNDENEDQRESVISRKLEKKNVENLGENDEDDDPSILSFNFIFYILQKFKFPDFLRNSY